MSKGSNFCVDSKPRRRIFSSGLAIRMLNVDVCVVGGRDQVDIERSLFCGVALNEEWAKVLRVSQEKVTITHL